MMLKLMMITLGERLVDDDLGSDVRKCQVYRGFGSAQNFVPPRLLTDGASYG